MWEKSIVPAIQPKHLQSMSEQASIWLPGPGSAVRSADRFLGRTCSTLLRLGFICDLVLGGFYFAFIWAEA